MPVNVSVRNRYIVESVEIYNLIKDTDFTLTKPINEYSLLHDN
jgi:hypothetical protein